MSLRIDFQYAKDRSAETVTVNLHRAIADVKPKVCTGLSERYTLPVKSDPSYALPLFFIHYAFFSSSMLNMPIAFRSLDDDVGGRSGRKLLD
jgi:hypothetical protein